MKSKIILLVAFFYAMPLHAAVFTENENGSVNAFSFKGTPLQEFISEYSSFMNKVVMVNSDVRMKGKKVYLNVPKAISRNQLREYFYTALNWNDLAALEKDSFVQVVSRRKVFELDLPNISADKVPESSQFFQVFFPLRYADAKHVERTLRLYTSREGRIFSMEKSAILLVETGQNINKLKKIVYALDIPQSVEGRKRRMLITKLKKEIQALDELRLQKNETVIVEKKQE